jgi:hypothetical protein
MNSMMQAISKKVKAGWLVKKFPDFHGTKGSSICPQKPSSKQINQGNNLGHYFIRSTNSSTNSYNVKPKFYVITGALLTWENSV